MAGDGGSLRAGSRLHEKRSCPAPGVPSRVTISAEDLDGDNVARRRRAIRANIEIMRAFVRTRHLLHPTAALARKLEELEEHCDERFSVVFNAIRELMAPPKVARKRIGFRP